MATEAENRVLVKLIRTFELADELERMTDEEVAGYLEKELAHTSMLSPAFSVAEAIIARLRRAGGGPYKTEELEDER